MKIISLTSNKVDVIILSKYSMHDETLNHIDKYFQVFGWFFRIIAHTKCIKKSIIDK